MSTISTDQSINNVLAIKQAQIQQEVDTEVAREALDATKKQGAAVLSLLTSAVQFAQQISPTHVDIQV